MPAREPVDLAVLLSGSGTTLQNMIDRIEDGRLRARVRLVASSRSDAFGLERAKRHGIPYVVRRSRDYPDFDALSEAVWRDMEAHSVDLICLAGFMCLLSVPDRWVGRIINIHPALIPAFCGKGMYGHRVHEAVLEQGCKVSGCTVHFADRQYDHGPIILQRTVPVLEDDTPDTLADRVGEAEREAYPEAVRLFGEGRLHIEGRRVRVTP